MMHKKTFALALLAVLILLGFSPQEARADCAEDLKVEEKKALQIGRAHLQTTAMDILKRANEAAAQGKKKKCEKLLNKLREVIDRDKT
ncbi:MAG: hypothetical protein COW30_04010 [Rhodospirillales bacterium CG15_BIG_FIL_POST_REV_8_21_14_020_66_15]|nr:MAG: hypothetical protein COW30_04010 [Rhodospirillales bacterium CG15_BIG_FIL_POST_REV_8_21_14_020_66_15]